MKNQYNYQFLLCILLFISCSQKEELRHESLMDKHAYPSDYMYLQRSYPSGQIDKEAFKEGQNIANKMKSQSTERLGEWKNAGPINIGGRIVDIEGSGSTVYVGTASGGIFKTNNKGNSWDPIFDNESTLSIGDLAISKSNNNVIYVGTGEANAGGGSLAYDGEGVFKSTDSGDSWENIGLEEVGSIGRLAIDPNDDDIVFVAAMGTLFSQNTERGIFRTKDGGDTWEKVLYISPKTGGIDVVINPQNPNIIYAALWERERLLNDRTYHGPTSGIYKSEDGGDTWVEQTLGLPGGNKGRIGIAMSPSNPDVIYATYTAPSGILMGIFKTENGGLFWQLKSSENITSVGFMWWFGRMKVHPENEDIVYHIGFRMNKSTDGGNTWEDSFVGVHVDQHEIWIDPENPEDVYLGNDGGVFFSSDGGLTQTKIDNMPITQFYRCEVDFLEPDRLYGGSQDNSTIRTLTGSNNDWEFINGGDGFTALVDPTDNNYVYAISQYGNLRRSEDGGFSFVFATDGVDPIEPNNWNTPYVFDPNNPEIMYYGTNRLYKSEDRAITWSAISDDLSNGPYEGVNPFGTLTAISVSPFNSSQILVGTDDGNVWITNDLGSSWEKISESLPNRWVTSLSHHPTIENRFYVTYSGYRYGENSAYAYTMNYPTEDWVSISDGLPQVPINDLLIVPLTGEKIIASDVGVFISDEDNQWEILSSELPNVIITDLDYHEPSDKLIVATYGRSMYTYIFDRNVNINENQKASLLSVYPNPASDYLNVNVKEAANIKEINVYSFDGSKIYFDIKMDHFKESNQLDISTLPAGKYVLSIQTEKQFLSSMFLVH